MHGLFFTTASRAKEFSRKRAAIGFRAFSAMDIKAARSKWQKMVEKGGQVKMAEKGPKKFSRINPHLLTTQLELHKQDDNTKHYPIIQSKQ